MRRPVPMCTAAKVTGVLLLTAWCGQVLSQAPSAFKPLRYEEDHSWLRNDTSGHWYHRLKFFPLSDDKRTYAGIGGETRMQYFYSRNEAWGDAPFGNDGYLLNRSLLHLDVRSGSHFRVFAQLQSSLAFGREEPSPVDENPLELHQAFTDVKAGLFRSASLTFRVGRQEWMFGSQRLISVREGPNNRQSFDGARTMLTGRNHRTDLFYGHYVAGKKGSFNDGFNSDAKVWGAYTVTNHVPVAGNADLYYIGLWKRRAVFDDGRGEEQRHSAGARIWRNGKAWKYDTEALYQFGKFAGKSISAWTASVNASYTFFKARLKPELGLKTELISGDRQYDDNKLQTFNPLYPRGAYFGLAALIGPSNLVDIHPSLALSLNHRLGVGFDHDVFWRYSRHDGLYAVNGALLYSGRTIADKFVGGQSAFSINYTPNRFLGLTAEFTWFDAGAFLEAAGNGKDIIFTGVTAQLKF